MEARRKLTERNASTSIELAALSQRVNGIEDGLRSVVSMLNDLSIKIDSRSQTNWQPIWAALGVMTSVLGLTGAVVYMPIKDNQLRQEAAIERVERRAENIDERVRQTFTPRSEYEGDKKDYERTVERLIKRLDRIEFEPIQRRVP